MSLLNAIALHQRLALHGSPAPRSTHGLATMARYDILLAPASPAAFAAHRLLDARDALLRHRLEVKAERLLQRML